MMRTVMALAVRGAVAIVQAREERNLFPENQGAIVPRSRALKEQATNLTGLSPEID